MDNVISVENVSKLYDLRQIGSGTLQQDFSNFFSKLTGRNAAELKAEENIREKSGNPLVWALKDISFSIKKGEVVGIIGNNGAGKSTLLKILSQITPPSSGRIKISGRISSLLEVGTGFHPELTGKENIFLNGAILGMKKHEIHKKMEEIVEFSGVARYLDTPVKRYSSGMVVRLGFAVAAHLNTDILVVDEVLAVGDLDFQKKCIGRMKDFSSDGKTVLFVSHNLLAVERLTQRSILLERGKILLDAPTKDVLRFYTSRSLQNRFDPKKRSGLHNIKVEDVIFNNNESVKCGESLEIKIKLSIRHSGQLNGIRCAIAFDNSLGSRITLFDSELLGNKMEVDKHEPTILFRTSKLTLLPDLYMFSIYLEGPSGVEDWIIEGGGIEIQPGDFYGSGKIPNLDQGLIAHEFGVST